MNTSLSSDDNNSNHHENHGDANEKRRFTRVPFVSHITLNQNDTLWEGTVVDVSLNGVLVSSKSLYRLNDNSIIHSTITFEDGTELHATLQLAHHHEDFYGFCFKAIDSDSAAHLRNIITHNIGDSSACDRELLSLFSYHQ